MKSCRTWAGRCVIWGLAWLLIGGVTLDVRTQDVGTNPSGNQDEFSPEDWSGAPRDESRPRQPRRVGDLVNVFSKTEVSATEQASSVVTVWGDAEVRGQVRYECVTVFGNTKIAPEAKLESDCITVFGDLDLDTTVRGDVVVVMGNARFGPKTVVQGECIVVGGRITADPAATFERAKREFAAFLPPVGAWFKYGMFWGRPLVPSLGWVWLVFMLHVIVYLLVAILLPKPVAACEQTLRDQPLVTFGVGLLGLFLFWPAVTIIAATGVGVLVIPFLLVATIGGIILGKTATLQWMGRSALRAGGVDPSSLALAGFLLGTVIVTVLYVMPVLGFVTWGLLLPLGFGAAVMALIELTRQQRAKRPPAPPVPLFVPTPPTSSPSSTAAAASPATAPSVDASSLTMPATAGGPSVDVVPALPPGTASLVEPPAAASFAASPPTGTVAAELTGLARAGFWIRLAATLLDLILLGWFIQIVDGYFPLLWLGYHVGMWTWKGTTIGGIVCSLKVVREDGRPLDLTVALVRSLAAVFSFIALGLGFFWAGWSPERQSWHDKIAGTVIVKVPKGMPLI